MEMVRLPKELPKLIQFPKLKLQIILIVQSLDFTEQKPQTTDSLVIGIQVTKYLSEDFAHPCFGIFPNAGFFLCDNHK